MSCDGCIEFLLEGIALEFEFSEGVVGLEESIAEAALFKYGLLSGGRTRDLNVDFGKFGLDSVDIAMGDAFGFVSDMKDDAEDNEKCANDYA